MEMSNIKISFSNHEKIKIIALTGRLASGVEEVKNYLINNHKNIQPIHQVRAGSDELSSNEFLEKIIRGDIIEAYCDENNIIWGTDKTQLLTCYVYVGVYTPQQISNLIECNDVEILPIEIEMQAESRILHLLGSDCNPDLVRKVKDENEIYEICNKFLQDKKYDNSDLDNINCFLYNVNSYKELNQSFKDSSFRLALREFNETYKLISNLDNFI